MTKKKKPQTIADLKINLTFSKTSNYCLTFAEFKETIKKNNPELINYKIKPGLYSFRIWIPTGEIDSDYYHGEKCSLYEWVVFQINIPKSILKGDEIHLFEFLYRINYNIYLNIQKDTNYYVELDGFKREYDDFHYLIELGLPF